MRQQEAEQEAARRNAEDQRRDRFLFYALDHSAGMGDDAWEVEMRLRTADDAPLPAAVPLTAAAPAQQIEEAVPAEETRTAVEALPATEAFDALEAADSAELVGPLEPVDDDAAPAVRATEMDTAPAVRATDTAAAPAPPPRRRLRPRVIQVWGAFVILVGLLFVGATLLLSVALRDYTHFGVIPTSIGIALGLGAVWVGVALARTH
jgi:hypothetical protein